jgi:hypothetical protein
VAGGVSVTGRTDTPLEQALQLVVRALVVNREECSERERLAFADTAVRMLRRSCARELLLIELDEALRDAA